MEKRNRLIGFAVFAVILLAAVIMIITRVAGGGDRTVETVPAPVEAAAPLPEPEGKSVRIVEKEIEKIVETIVPVEKEITSEIINEGLNNMGFLITQEYYFTEVVSYSSVRTFLNWNVPGTQSSYLVGYDGVITSGVDFEQITVRKNEETGNVTVAMPAAQIKNVDIDPASFVLYSEKESIMNKTSVEDYNASLVELESTAKTKAIERGVLEQANENARNVVENFIRGLLGSGDYTVTFTVK